MNITISPSQLGFILDGCPRCIWLYFRKIGPPKGGYETFNLMDRVQQAALKKGADLRPLGIPGQVCSLQDWVQSEDYHFGEHSACIRGKYDLLAILDDGGHAVVDLKTAKPRPEKAIEYGRQLSGYALALREPERFEAKDIRAAYVLPWWPEENVGAYIPEAIPPSIMCDFRGYAIEATIDTAEVKSQMEKLVYIAASVEVPHAAGECPNCNYVRGYSEAVRKSKETARALDEARTSEAAEVG